MSRQATTSHSGKKYLLTEYVLCALLGNSEINSGSLGGLSGVHHSQAGTVSLLGTPKASLGVKVTFLERLLGTDSKDQEKLKNNFYTFQDETGHKQCYTQRNTSHSQQDI